MKTAGASKRHARIRVLAYAEIARLARCMGVKPPTVDRLDAMGIWELITVELAHWRRAEAVSRGELFQPSPAAEEAHGPVREING
jgi:hypothetical protein